MYDMETPFLLGLRTMSRAVGVPISVNTVSKLTVSREKVSTAEGDVVMSSSMQLKHRRPSAPNRVKITYRNSFIYEKRTACR